MRSRDIAMLLVTLSVLTDCSILFLHSAFAAPIQISQQFSWGNILAGLRRRKPPMGSRGEICILSPAEVEEVTLMVDTQPVFLWQGRAGAIALRRAGEAQPFWRKPTGVYPERGTASHRVERVQLSLQKPGVRRFRYTGEPLQPGQTYELLLFEFSATPYPKARQSFRIIPEAERTQVVADLNRLNQNLKAKGLSEEQISLHRANNFVRNQLWSSAVQEVYSVKNPSAELSKVVQEIPAKICGQ